MNKIATRQYVANLTGGNTTDEENRCATKKWIIDNYPNVVINGEYADNQLVCEKDITIILTPIITITTSKSNITLRVNEDNAATIAWGDGAQESIANKSNLSHTYSDGVSEHRIIIYGEKDALTSLDCNKCEVSELDVSKNTALITLDCNFNQLTKLDVSQNTELRRLDCGFNQLTQLDVSQNTELIRLDCGFNQLTQLDVSQNVALSGLYCHINQITSLDVSKNTGLHTLWCYSNQLTQLDVSKNTRLADLYCPDNQLTQLDVSQNTALRSLYCDMNPFVTDESALKAFANTLPQKEASNKGTLYIGDDTSEAWIQSICDAKNWNII